MAPAKGDATAPPPERKKLKDMFKSSKKGKASGGTSSSAEVRA
jgi:hypothetical protein